MNKHVDNVVNNIMKVVEINLDDFADYSGLVISSFEHDTNGIYVDYNIKQAGRMKGFIYDFFDKKIDKLINDMNTRILYDRKDKERYITNNGIVFKWDGIIFEEFLPTIEKGINDNVLQSIKREEHHFEDYIVEYEESDERGEYSYFVSEHDLYDEFDHLKNNIHISTDFISFWDIETIVDRWEERQRR